MYYNDKSEINITFLAKASDITRSSTCIIVTKLFKQKIIEKIKYNLKEKRAIYYRLTTQGKDLIELMILLNSKINSFK